jgi:hypothetical protein
VRSGSLRLLSLLSLLLAELISPAFLQSQSPTPPLQERPRTRLPQVEEPPTAEDEAHARAEKEMEKKANKRRQEQIKHDTDQLFQLATELKAYVDKTNENILSLDVIRKADQIERLAHNVKDKMKQE